MVVLFIPPQSSLLGSFCYLELGLFLGEFFLFPFPICSSCLFLLLSVPFFCCVKFLYLFLDGASGTALSLTRPLRRKSEPSPQDVGLRYLNKEGFRKPEEL